MDSNKTSGAITGAVIAAAAAQWGRYDDDTQRRLRDVRADAEGAIDMIWDAQSRGEAIRARLPSWPMRRWELRLQTRRRDSGAGAIADSGDAPQT